MKIRDRILLHSIATAGFGVKERYHRRDIKVSI